MTNVSTSNLHTKPIVIPIPSAASNEVLTKPTARLNKTNSAEKPTVITTATKSDKAISKQTELIQLIQRPEGIALSELKKLTDWQVHSIRGWISGVLRKKLGLVVTRFKSDNGDTCYRIEPTVVSE